ncbi:MAG TPA: OmpA family protein [Longimicrobium sp.]|nr:OmpA family protein [Longimicrobium sp.]
MKLRHAAVLFLIPLVLVGCRKRRPAEPGPQTDTTTVVTDDTGAREDSIRLADERRAEEERLERERRAREGAAASAREVLTEIVFFEYDSDEIQGDAEERLRLKAAVLRDNPGVRIRIDGHADQRGSTEYNLALAQRRAEAVAAFLENYGISASRFHTISYGEERPLVEGDDEEAYARNRRAEFSITGGSVVNVPAEIQG